ncbi:hypothetical protein B0J17DRAFT_683453 [Rhizoctonia solani]|nr:hypothetical protein B0J17DRAFT_683453 [Rhizoctonia solani]
MKLHLQAPLLLMITSVASLVLIIALSCYSNLVNPSLLHVHPTSHESSFEAVLIHSNSVAANSPVVYIRTWFPFFPLHQDQTSRGRLYTIVLLRYYPPALGPRPRSYCMLKYLRKSSIQSTSIQVHHWRDLVGFR